MSGPATDDDDELFASWSSFARYPAMLGGTFAGQLVGHRGRRLRRVALALDTARLQRRASRRWSACATRRAPRSRPSTRASARACRATYSVVLARRLGARSSSGSRRRIARGRDRGSRVLLRDASCASSARWSAFAAATAGARGAHDRAASRRRAVIATFLGALRLALGAIARNKMRAALTVLGIFIGITAVVIVTAAVDERHRLDHATPSTASAANALYVSPQPTQASGARAKTAGRLTESDGRAIAREAVSVSGVAPWLSTPGQVVYGDKNWSTTAHRHGALVLPHPPLHDRQRRALDRDRRDLQDEGLRHRPDGGRRTSSARRSGRAARSASAARRTRVIGVLGVARDLVLRRRPGRHRS